MTIPNDQVDNIMRLASLLATARVRRYVASKEQGDTNGATRRVDEAEKALRDAVEAAVPSTTITEVVS